MTRSPSNEGLQGGTGPRRGLSKLQRELSQTVPLANFCCASDSDFRVLQGRPSREQAGRIMSGAGHGTEPLQLPEFSTLL